MHVFIATTGPGTDVDLSDVHPQKPFDQWAFFSWKTSASEESNAAEAVFT